MLDRVAAARRFAELMGWQYHESHPSITFWNIGGLPAPDAPLHEHLAFVGRVAEAVKPRVILLRLFDCGAWIVSFRAVGRKYESTNPDLVHAALLAAVAALEARGGKP